MSLKVFKPILDLKIPKELKKNSVFGPFKEKYKGQLCTYFGGYRAGKKFGFGKMYMPDGSYVEGVFNHDKLGKTHQWKISSLSNLMEILFWERHWKIKLKDLCINFQK